MSYLRYAILTEADAVAFMLSSGDEGNRSDQEKITLPKLKLSTTQIYVDTLIQWFSTVIN